MFSNISAHQIHSLKYNQVCELFTSKSLNGNGQTLLHASCVSRKRTPGNPSISGKLRGQRGGVFRGVEEGTATLPLSFKPKHLLLWKPRSLMPEQQELSPSVPMQPCWERLDARCQLPRRLPEPMLIFSSGSFNLRPRFSAPSERSPAPPRKGRSTPAQGPRRRRTVPGRRPGPGQDPAPAPTPASTPAPAQAGPVAPGAGTALVYPRPVLPGATLGGFPLRGAEARFNAAKMN